MTMCGYITKDEGRAWYQYRIRNISREDLQQGRLQIISAQTAIDDGKVILTQGNFFSEMYKFSMRSLFPCVCPVRVVVMYALQSAAYIPALDWVRKFAKVDSHEAQALWKAAWNPKLITLADSDRIFFDGYSRPRNRERYFVTPEGDSGINGDVCSSDGREGDVACDEEPCVTPRKRWCSPYENIRRVMHERVSTQSERIIGCQRTFRR